MDNLIFDLRQKNLFQALRTGAKGAAGLAIHGSATENMLTASTCVHAIDGVFYSHAAESAIDLSAEDVGGEVIGDDKKAVVFVGWDTDGDLVTLLSDIVGLEDDVEVPYFDMTDVCIVSACLIKNETGSDFTIGTTGLDTSGVTDTYKDLSTVIPGETLDWA